MTSCVKKNEIILIQPDYSENYLYFPSALLLLGTFLKQLCLSTSIIDFNYLRLAHKLQSNEILKKIPYSSKKIYGISINYSQLNQAIQISRFLKKREPNCLIILGGPGLFGVEEEIIQRFHKYIDCIAIQDGIDAFLQFTLQKNLNKDSIPGIVFWSQDQKRAIRNAKSINSLYDDINNWPATDYSIYPEIKHYLQFQKVKEWPILAGFGCPHNCTFCSTSEFWGRKYKIKTPEKLKKEIKNIQKKFKVTQFSLLHDNLFPSDTKLLSYLNKLNLGKEIRWSTALRLNILSDEVLEFLSQKGCNGITIGIETASTEVQKTISKNLDISCLEKIIKKMAELKIDAHLGFILDLPEGNAEEDKKTCDLAFKLQSHYPNVFASLNAIKFLNGSTHYPLRKTYIRRIQPLIGQGINFLLKNFSKSIYNYSSLIEISTIELCNILLSENLKENILNSFETFLIKQNRIKNLDYFLYEKSIFDLEQNNFIKQSKESINSIFDKVEGFNFQLISFNSSIDDIKNNCSKKEKNNSSYNYLLCLTKGKNAIFFPHNDWTSLLIVKSSFLRQRRFINLFLLILFYSSKAGINLHNLIFNFIYLYRECTFFKRRGSC